MVVREILDLVAKVATIFGWLESGTLVLKLSVLALVAVGVGVFARLQRRRVTVAVRGHRRRLGGLEAHVGRLEDLETPYYRFARGIVASDLETPFYRFARGIVASERGGMDGSA